MCTPKRLKTFQSFVHHRVLSLEHGKKFWGTRNFTVRTLIICHSCARPGCCETPYKKEFHGQVIRTLHGEHQIEGPSHLKNRAKHITVFARVSTMSVPVLRFLNRHASVFHYAGDGDESCRSLVQANRRSSAPRPRFRKHILGLRLSATPSDHAFRPRQSHAFQPRLSATPSGHVFRRAIRIEDVEFCHSNVTSKRTADAHL